MSVVESLLEARAAFERRDWVAAYEGLSAMSAAELAGQDFANLATAAALTGRRNDCIQALQRAYQLLHKSGDVLAAIRCACSLAQVLTKAGESAVAGGWIARANRLLDDLGGDVAERGYVQLLVMFRHIFAGEFPQAAVCASAVTDYGKRFSDPDLLAMGLCSQGRMAMYEGRVQEGIALLDEAMVGISTGEVSPLFAGRVYCTMIEGCQEVSDYGRVIEWTMALTNWCDDQPGLVVFTGQCAVHRGQIMRIRGAYREALREYAGAVDRYIAAGTEEAVGLAMAEKGEVLRILGKYKEAEQAYSAATAYGHDPQPGLALVWLASGQTRAAAAAVRRILEETQNPVHRSRALPASIEVLLAVGDMDAASAASAELDRIATAFGCTALLASANYTGGQVLLAKGEAGDATPRFRSAAHDWALLGCRYESARCAVALGRGLSKLGDTESAAAQWVQAREIFRELGATPAQREIDDLLVPSVPAGLTTREVEVLRLVAAGNSNADIATALFLSEKTVARHMSNIFGKIGVNTRTAAAKFAFDHRLA
ncbi:helix-turn-helix transcriptional regulator [Hoyosella altamirensis]|uniref:helix-turn-helix transcriptional regulator n=1 Tax=Hoyosella altamirensis TaxID=616997 RepID=UPI0007DB4255|nr:helix-turn-helix transcriptional regulator [Hoyosella altamirensis]